MVQRTFSCRSLVFVSRENVALLLLIPCLYWERVLGWLCCCCHCCCCRYRYRYCHCYCCCCFSLCFCVQYSELVCFHLQSVPFIVLHKDELGCGFSRISSRQRHISRVCCSFPNALAIANLKIIEKWIWFGPSALKTSINNVIRIYECHQKQQWWWQWLIFLFFSLLFRSVSIICALWLRCVTCCDNLVSFLFVDILLKRIYYTNRFVVSTKQTLALPLARSSFTISIWRRIETALMATSSKQTNK